MIWMLIVSSILLSVALWLCIYSVCTLNQSIDLRKRVIRRREEIQILLVMMLAARSRAIELLDEAIYERKLAQYLSEINQKNRSESNEQKDDQY